jgi:hypothetical protein
MRFERITDETVVERRRDRAVAVLVLAGSVYMVAAGHLAAILGIVLAFGAWFGLHRRI